MECGNYGLFATNTSDILIQYANGQWFTVGNLGTVGPQAAYAVGDHGVLALSNSGILNYYDGRFDQYIWYPLSTAATSVLGDSALYYTDTSGNLYQFQATTNFSGVEFGTSCDEFATDGSNVYALMLNHGAVIDVSNSGGTWQLIGGAAAQIFAGGAGAGFLGATTLDGNMYTALWQGGTNWTYAGGPGYQFVVGGASGAEELFGIASNTANGVSQDPALTPTFPNWNLIGGQTGGLFIRGGTLFAAGGLIYVNESN